MNFSSTGTVIVNVPDNIDEFMIFRFRNIDTHKRPPKYINIITQDTKKYDIK